VALLALCRVRDVSWSFVAREAQRPDGLQRLLAGRASESGADADKSLDLIRRGRGGLDALRAAVESMLASAKADGFRLTTVLDPDYPVNLRIVHNLPPFLFYQGRLATEDAYSVAVVGTRQATEEGLRRARKMASMLAEAGVTVLSGLARGIDTAAHEACLAAGGRTVAVLGSGIRRVYPPEAVELAERITSRGAVVSQFWPDAPPSRITFPQRNVVTSGMGQGTVVIEASSTSGAKMQARLAVEHGKQVFLLSSLVDEHQWARRYLARPRVHQVSTVEDILRLLRSPEQAADRAAQRLQMNFALG
jgi:DNA processing protein